MSYQIDQSIKIEDTSKTTYVSLVNGEEIIVSISAKDKRELKLFFRELNKPLIFKIFTFSVLCAHAIKSSDAKNISIDCEYAGHEIDIKSFIVQILTIEKASIPDINFTRVGKKSRAHEAVHHSLENREKGSVVNIKEVISYYVKVNKA
jgi:hypothetical protein